MNRLAAALAVLASAAHAGAATEAKPKSRLTADTFAGLALRSIGPALMSGRVSDIAIDPSDRSTWYVAAGSGGVWKTTNAGTTWEPIFDAQRSYSIGCISIDPSRPQTLWVGTGENSSGRHVGFGDGVYKSRDGGKTWTNTGLGQSEHVSRIVVDPRHPDVVFAAAEGPLWSSGGERGVYRTNDGGASWKRVLELGPDTGVTDLVYDPKQPDVMWAAAYQRRRSVWALLAGGPESGIYKTTDGGNSWRRLANGLPKGDMGRIGLTVSPLDSRLVYATIEAAKEDRGFYRSADGGESWEKRNEYLSDGTGPHYYQEIFASPHKLDRVYQTDVWLHVTDDGGKTFSRVGERAKHSDNHALAFDPSDPEYLLAGCDGGLYESFDHGGSWKFVSNLPLTQIYKLALDDAQPFYNVVGGTQDNGTQLGPSRTPTLNGIRNSDWKVPYGADGYSCQIDPENPDTLYVEAQNGNLLRYDKRSGEVLDIRPQPGADDPPERWNWDAPVLISPHSSSRLYYGSQRLWRSDDRGSSWKPLSGDLSRARNRYALPMRGRVQSVDALYGNTAMSWYGNLTSLSESPKVEGLIYAGTDDGLIQVTEDGGASWRRVERIAGVPEGAFVNDVKASLHDADTVYAALDSHKTGDYKPYLVMSSDRGRSWKSIAGDLPERHIVWALAQDHVEAGLLFAGTELGLFFSPDAGGRWIQLKGGVPTIAFRDIEIQRRAGDLVGASFGRGFYVLDDYAPLREASAARLDAEAALFSVRRAPWYVPQAPLAMRGQAQQGDAFFVAPNPPFGAVFSYYLRDELRSSRQQRREGEKALEEKKQDVPFPGWEALRAEDLAKDPAIVLTVSDAEGQVVRRLTGPAKAGFQRVAWDLRYPTVTPVDLTERELDPWESPPAGPLAPPGRYSVRLAKLVDGVLTPLADPQSFETAAIGGATFAAADPKAVLAFERETGELLRRAAAASERAQELEKRMPFLVRALLDTPGAPAALLQRARALELRIAGLRERLTGDRTLARFNEPAVPSILGRVQEVAGGHWNTSQGPTETNRQSLALAQSQFGPASAELTALAGDLAALEKEMEAAGAPWTPGRSLGDTAAPREPANP